MRIWRTYLHVIHITLLAQACALWHDRHDMANLYMITFRCRWDLYERLERFAIERNIDRTSAIKLALHYYLNRCSEQPHTESEQSQAAPVCDR